MAVSSKIEEVILEITRVAGQIYNVNYNGIGSVDQPNTAISEINNLYNLAVYGLPYFGTIETSSLGFQISYNSTSDRYNVRISSGQAAFKNNLVTVPTQTIPIKKDFSKVYSLTTPGADAFKYGITVGLPYEQLANSAQIWETTVKTESLLNTSVVFVTDTTIASTLGFPIEAHVGSVYLRFSEFNSNKTGLVIDPSFKVGSNYGKLENTILADTPVRFIYQPKLKYLSGFPIETTNENPSSFNYFPELPKDWLPIAKILVINPDNPKVAGTLENAYIRTVYDFPTNSSSNPILGNSTDIGNVIQSSKSAINDLNSLSKNISVTSIIQALKAYTGKQTSGTKKTFKQFWSAQPFRPTSYYAKGISFSGLEKFQFPYDFARAYYDATGEDLNHIFATFRGDLITYNSTLMSNNKVNSALLSSIVISCSNYVSSLDSGTQIYGVSVVSNISLTEYGESVPVYTSQVSTDTTNSNYLVELTWQGTGVSNPMFYHVYKRPKLASELVERKLTNVSEINYSPYNTLTTVTDTENFEIDTPYIAMKVLANENCFIGGITFKMGYINPTAVIYNPNTTLKIGLYSSTGANPNLASPVSSEDTFRYGDLKDGTENEYTIKFSTGANLVSGTTYWLGITKSSSLLVGSGTTENFYTRSISTGTYNLLSSNDGGTWSNESKTGYFKLRGYIDTGSVAGELIRRGIQLTNRIAFSPQRLSVYVPPVESISGSTGLRFDGSSTGITSVSDSTIKNDLIVTVTARNGINGTATTLSTTVPKGTVRDTRFILGTSTDLFDRVDDVVVEPGTNLTRSNNGPILWDIYDLITVETVP